MQCLELRPHSSRTTRFAMPNRRSWSDLAYKWDWTPHHMPIAFLLTPDFLRWQNYSFWSCCRPNWPIGLDWRSSRVVILLCSRCVSDSIAMGTKIFNIGSSNILLAMLSRICPHSSITFTRALFAFCTCGLHVHQQYFERVYKVRVWKLGSNCRCIAFAWQILAQFFCFSQKLVALSRLFEAN